MWVAAEFMSHSPDDPDRLRAPRMITSAPCCRQNAAVSPAHAATETLSQPAGSSRRSWIARPDGVLAGCLSLLTATSTVTRAKDAVPAR
jgi:hypothetical protein